LDRLRRYQPAVLETVHLAAAHALRRRDPPHGGEEEPVQQARTVLQGVECPPELEMCGDVLQTEEEDRGLRRRQAAEGRSALHPAEGQARDRHRHRQGAGQDPLEVPVALLWEIAERLVLRTPLRRTMLTAPPADGDAAAFEQLLHAVEQADGGEIDYDVAAPKHAFFRYLVDHRPVLLHGTGDASIDRFEPRRQTDYDNEW